MMEATEAFLAAPPILPQRHPREDGAPYEGITPHPVPLPLGEGTLELRSERAAPSPLPEGEGQGEGSDGSSSRQPLMQPMPAMTVENAANFITYSSVRMASPKRRARDDQGMFRKSKAL
jgi:hypothetical protein